MNPDFWSGRQKACKLNNLATRTDQDYYHVDSEYAQTRPKVHRRRQVGMRYARLVYLHCGHAVFIQEHNDFCCEPDAA
jgi:hypothetical protein